MNTFFIISLYLTYMIYGSMATGDRDTIAQSPSCVALRKSNPSTSVGQLSLDMSCDERVTCIFEFTNKGSKDIYILKRNTPLEGLISPFIAVYSQTGHPLKYKGIYAFRLPPTNKGFVLLKAGKTISATVDITEAFSIDSDGLYTIEYTEPVQYVTELKLPYKLNNAVIYQSGSIYLEDTHLLPKPQVFKEEEYNEKDIITTQAGCRFVMNDGTQSQRNAIQTAHDSVCKYVGSVKNSVTNNDLYKTWFGSYTGFRATRVKQCFADVDVGLATKIVTYELEKHNKCGTDVIAHTLHGATVVYFCPPMFGLTVLCQNFLYSSSVNTQSGGNYYSQELVVMHEWSHAFGYTSDYKYGVSADQSLACYHPSIANNNADNYSYYYCKASQSYRG